MPWASITLSPFEAKRKYDHTKISSIDAERVIFSRREAEEKYDEMGPDKNQGVGSHILARRNPSANITDWGSFYVYTMDSTYRFSFGYRICLISETVRIWQVVMHISFKTDGEAGQSHFSLLLTRTWPRVSTPIRLPAGCSKTSTNENVVALTRVPFST